VDLLEIYTRTLEACAPAALVREALARERVGREPTAVVALGKCAAGLIAGARSAINVSSAVAAIPSGYPAPDEDCEVLEGSHPSLSTKSFAAGERLREFVSTANSPILFLVSGGSSACAESPLRPHFDERDLIGASELLLRSGLPIETINTARKHLSAIKGGRLAAVTRRPRTLIYSDVPRGREEHVGSGPTLPDPTTNEDAARVLESIGSPLAARLCDPRLPDTPSHLPAAGWSLVADNRTMVERAAALSGLPLLEEEMNGEVEQVARLLHHRMRSGKAFVTGGEPTVVVRGEGRGGRCSELALRFARLCIREPIGNVHAVFAGSDGLDGNSGAAGFVVHIDESSRLDEGAFLAAIARSDSYRLAATVGQPILIPPTGNNLRDLFIVARDWHV
jgi:glycerate 2-kinase